MRYCRRCIIPDTRPNISFDATGLCSACAAYEARPQVDWAKREAAFRDVVAQAQARSKGYDCVIPVSGGKDSTWQVVRCLEYGLNPLAVTWRPPARTAVGERNLANLIRLGVDHIDYRINPDVEKVFTYQALVRYGDPGIPMHMAIFNIPVTVAVRFGIPLIVWGENSAIEYAGDDEEHMGFRMDASWVARYGVTHGTTARDWVSEALTEKQLTPYFGPTPDELAAREVLAVFLGYYFPWDPAASLAVAKSHGFSTRAEGPKTGYYDYADIDDDFISIHHYLKWYKFGFTRLNDNLSLEIRHGRMTREEAVAIVRERGDETPHEDIEKFCHFLGITKQRFFEIIEPFRNQDVWANQGGTWMIEDFLIPDWDWT